MDNKAFSWREALQFGWNLVKSDIGFFVALTLVFMVITNIPGTLAEGVKERLPGMSFFLQVIGAVIGGIVTLGLARITLDFCDGEHPGIGRLFEYYSLLWRYLGASVVYILIVLAGTILLIVPGIIWAIRYSFYYYFIVDSDAGAMESLRRSAEITKGAIWDVFVFDLIGFLVIMAGFLACFIGILVAMPTVMLAQAWVYRALLTRWERASLPAEEPIS